MPDFVFLGPSLPVDDARALLPGATFLPPIEHGDLLRLAPTPDDRILIIDGLFLLKAPVRHREIMALLRQGTMIAGSSSMGAMRAAELHRYGMRGVGRVFELFRDGVVTGDDEVALVHGPAEEGYRPMSEPLVNVRVALRAAVASDVLSTVESDALLAAMAAVPFRGRTYRTLRRLAGPHAEAAARFLAWYEANPCDAKADDARLLLRLAAADAPELAPAGPADDRVEHPETHYNQAWQTRHHGAETPAGWVSDARAISAVMLLHPGFPAALRESMLRAAIGVDPDAAQPHGTELTARALAVARERGLLGGTDDEPVAYLAEPAWIADHERDLPDTERVLRTLVRAFGTMHCRAISRLALPPSIADPVVLERARRFAATAANLNDKLPRPVAHRPLWRMHFRDEVIDAVFTRIWDCPPDRLEAAAWDRGFDDLARLRVVAEPFVAALKVFGPPELLDAAEAATPDPATLDPASPEAAGPEPASPDTPRPEPVAAERLTAVG